MNRLEEFFIFKAKKGLQKRLAEIKYPVDVETYNARLEYEIDIIIKTGFTGYFLIVSDFIGWARRNGIRVGPGRGSAAGALVSFALGITNLDPIKYELYFERFLNPSRAGYIDLGINKDLVASTSKLTNDEIFDILESGGINDSRFKDL